MTNIGDDLIEARDFVNSTIESMDILLSDARLNVELAQSALRDIRLDARRLMRKGLLAPLNQFWTLIRASVRSLK